MRFFFDNCISSRLVRGMQAFEDGHKTVLVHLSERFSPDTKDPVWLRALGAEGNWIIISGDPRIRKSPDNRTAWLEAGLTTYFVSDTFINRVGWPQVEELVRWWDPLKLHARKEAELGRAYTLPWGEKKPRLIDEPKEKKGA